jgi:GNAT superfamily N-acetyltransferase
VCWTGTTELVIELTIREGSADDEADVLALFDEAVEWLVERGLSGQWGEQAFSTRPDMRGLVRRTLADNQIRIAEHEGAVVGVLAVGTSPPYVPGNPLPELYIALLLSSRQLRGNQIGLRLLDLATEIARERGARMVRVDCWADSPRLVKFYERHGFACQGLFDLRGWRGQILSKAL